MTLDKLKQEVNKIRGSRMDTFLYYIKEAAIYGDNSVTFSAESIEDCDLKGLKCLGYTVDPYNRFYKISGW